MFQNSKKLGHLKKLVLVSATSALMINTCRETALRRVPWIRYLVQFRQKNDKDEDKNILALMDFDYKVNTMYPAYDTKLGVHA